MTKEQFDNLAKLCEALESGQYEKGSQCLRLCNNAYCCMGVAADLIDPQGWKEDYNKYSHRMGRNLCIMENEENGAYYLSEKALGLFGLTTDDQSKLTELNDVSKTFGPVIEHIRQYILTRYVAENDQ